jgi:hypothetical protein
MDSNVVESPSMTFPPLLLAIRVFIPTSTRKAVLRNRDSFFMVPFPVTIQTSDKFRISRAVYKKRLKKSCLFYIVSFLQGRKMRKNVQIK